MLIVLVGCGSTRVVAHCHSEPAPPQADSGSDCLQVSVLPLREMELGVDECVPQDEKHLPTSSLMAILSEDGVPSLPFVFLSSLPSLLKNSTS